MEEEKYTLLKAAKITQTTRLDRDAFASAIRKGLGRAWLFVNQYGLDDVPDLVLDACLYNQVYDPQCEEDREDWLYSMFSETSYYHQFRDLILTDLGIVKSRHSASQLSTLVKLMAKNGDEKAYKHLKIFVIKMANGSNKDDRYGVHDWIEIEGVMGMLDLARIYGQRLLDFSYDRPLSTLIDIKPEFGEILLQHKDSEPTLKVYWDYLKKNGKTKPYSTLTTSEKDNIWKKREKVFTKYGIERIIGNALNGKGKYPGYFARFGVHATKKELASIYDILINETEDKVRVRLLWVFRRAQLPALNDVFFEWATGESDDLVSATIAALARVSDKRIHELAKNKVVSGKLLGPNKESLKLFRENYEGPDALMISEALSKITPDPADAHSLGYSILNLVKEYKDVNLTDALIWVYENTPCTNCRHNIIEQLEVLNQLPDEILFECQFDASNSIREFAKARMENRSNLPRQNSDSNL